MADALCGPTNPLQHFKQQTSLDRTLQQDRLTSRLSPAQGFRSHDPNAGLLDPEFEAFQAGLPASDLPQYQPFQPHQQPFFAGPSQAPSWAQDFQQLQISPSPLQQQQYPSQSGPSTAGWAQGFRQHVPQSAPRSQHTSSPSPMAFQQRARMGYGGFQSQFTPQSSYAPNVHQSKGKEPVYEQFDDVAFEQAFAQAREEIMDEVEDKSSMQEDLDTVHDQLFNVIQNEQEAIFSPEEQAQTEEQRAHDEQDALAATAQELLSKVDDNKSDKFRNSQFLGLMRKLRDREVRVEGDKMVETVSSTLLKPAFTHTPSHDSTYASGTSTPMSWDSAHFDTHICNTSGCDVDHAYDHWESPATTESSTLNAPSTKTMPIFDNSEQRPSPLAAPAASRPLVDTRPPDYGHDDDADWGRIDPRDGQGVRDLLTEMGGGTVQHDEIGTSTIAASTPNNDNDNMPSAVEGEPPFYADLRAMHGPRTESASLSEMLYGHDGTLERPVVWSSRDQSPTREQLERGYVRKDIRQRMH
ncbi:hypothetical protein B0A55_02937 [Friedmanniomyces simplex]|uniref:Peroxin 20 n=1 Tax=Friedmanniomyces simplex TaxID=329884 RepID=A0A4U0XYH9_9PEZI|nr:hypothetical protein B0A55_02937 [Friedmanniomyces simplex]